MPTYRKFKITRVITSGSTVTQVSAVTDTGVTPASTFTLTKSSANVTDGEYAIGGGNNGVDVGDADLNNNTWNVLLPFANSYKLGTRPVKFNMYWEGYFDINSVAIAAP
jgi:hypothetical protein